VIEATETQIIGRLKLPKKIDPIQPIDEWLKGRTILTVAQEPGKGQFQTVQAALNQVKEGQAIEILDRGPYRENLLLNSPANVGLFSRQQAVIVSDGIIKPGQNGAHFIIARDRFRLHGIMFDTPLVKSAEGNPIFALMVQCTTGFVIDSCVFRNPDPALEASGLLAYWPETGSKWPVLDLRNNIFDAKLIMNSNATHARGIARVEQNWFRNRSGAPHWLHAFNDFAKLDIRHNLFTSLKPCVISIDNAAHAGVLEFTNNTVPDGTLYGDRALAPAQVTMLNNIVVESIRFDPKAQASLSAAIKSWQTGHNVYLRPPTGETQFPISDTEYIGQPKFLSTDPADANFLHIPTNAPEARRGRRGDWPDYLGAFPPGPAPSGMTWMTQMRARWSDVLEPVKP
jgi:hypothetical protein